MNFLKFFLIRKLIFNNGFSEYLTNHIFIDLFQNETAYYGEPVHLILVSTHNIFRSTDLLMDTPISVYSTNQTINGKHIENYCFIFYLCYNLK